MKMSRTTGVLAGCVTLALLAACEREVILPGERFDTRQPLAQALADGALASPAVVENRALPITLPRAQNLAEWSQMGGDARHSLPHGSLSNSPALVWSVKLGSGNSRSGRISAASIVAGGQVFAMDQANQVSAISAQTGAILWQTNLRAEFDGSTLSGGGLATSGGRVFATTGFGEVVAIDAASGNILWRQRLDGVISGAPTVGGDSVYVMTRDGSSTALNTATGRILWQAEGTDKSTGMLGAGTPATDGTMVYLPFGTGQIQAVDRAGVVKWMGAVAGQRLGVAYAGFGDVTGSPVIANGVLFAGSSAGRMVALDAQTGNRIWSADQGAMNAPLVVGGSLFVVNDQSRLLRMDARDGTVIWQQPMPYFTTSRPNRIKAITPHFGPVLAGGRLIVVSGDGVMRMFDPVSGAMTGQVDLPSAAASAPALAGGALFVMGANGQLHAFR
jgi:outer membrane protein assembly factor BamB